MMNARLWIDRSQSVSMPEVAARLKTLGRKTRRFVKRKPRAVAKIFICIATLGLSIGAGLGVVWMG